MHDVETEPMDQPTNAYRNNDRLVSRDRAERSAIEMIKMGVGDKDEIDRWQMMNVEPGFLQSLDHAQPHRPDRIDQHIRVMGLDQERGVTDPGDANLARLHFGKQWARAGAGTFCKKRRNPNAGNEIAFGPIA